MLGVLRNRTYRHLFLAQVVALLGTGLATVALGLLAFEISGEQAGVVLGTALAIKMIAYVTIAPIAGAFLIALPRRAVLVTLDVVRVAIVLVLPWVDQVWQIYVLIGLLQAASAAFTPLFQATIPLVLADEADYTRALSLSRLAYDLENLLSPALAGFLLLVISHDGLFFGTAFGFLGSALLVVSVLLPRTPMPGVQRGPWRKLTHGMRIYLATPRLRGLLALTLAAAAGGGFVIVNTVVLVRDQFGASQSAVAAALATFGAGSMACALLLPSLLQRWSDRGLMLTAATSMALILALLAVLWPYFELQPRWSILLGGWMAIGAAYAALVTPAGRLLRRSAQAEDLGAVFAAQFSLSHGCWLVVYPLVGWLTATSGVVTGLASMAAFAGVSVLLALRSWRDDATDILAHEHELPADHPHLHEHEHGHGPHAHRFVIDELHPHWPGR